jgi:hypothetical protein
LRTSDSSKKQPDKARYRVGLFCGYSVATGYAAANFELVSKYLWMKAQYYLCGKERRRLLMPMAIYLPPELKKLMKEYKEMFGEGFSAYFAGRSTEERIAVCKQCIKNRKPYVMDPERSARLKEELKYIF